MQAACLADTNKMLNMSCLQFKRSSGIVFHFISERKRRRWDQQASGDETPAKKKSSSWDQAEVGKLASQRCQVFFSSGYIYEYWFHVLKAVYKSKTTQFLYCL